MSTNYHEFSRMDRDHARHLYFVQIRVNSWSALAGPAGLFVKIREDSWLKS